MQELLAMDSWKYILDDYHDYDHFHFAVDTYVYVTGFAKRGLIHASDFPTLMRHNFICGLAMRLKFTVSLV